MKATVKVFAVELECPECEECIPAPNGSLFWSTDEIELLNPPYQVRCPICERVLIIGRKHL